MPKQRCQLLKIKLPNDCVAATCKFKLAITHHIFFHSTINSSFVAASAGSDPDYQCTYTNRTIHVSQWPVIMDFRDDGVTVASARPYTNSLYFILENN